MSALANTPHIPLSGTANALQLQSLVDAVDISGMVAGRPGSLTLSVPHLMAVSFSAAAPNSAAAAAAPQPLTAGQAALVQAAVTQANAAALITPSAASGNPTTANTPASTIQNMVKGVTMIAATPGDLKQLEAGATATLQWWGWTLKLNESSTQALSKLLVNDMAGLTALTKALAPISAPLAATNSMVSAVAAGLHTWISKQDHGHGVVIHGYLFVGLLVEGA
jgi:hypothetical protein